MQFVHYQVESNKASLVFEASAANKSLVLIFGHDNIVRLQSLTDVDDNPLLFTIRTNSEKFVRQ